MIMLPAKKYDEYIRESVDLDELLIDASKDGDTNKVEELLDRGANIEARSWYGNTPLSCAAINTDYDTVVLLLDRGAYINTSNNDGDTPMILAVSDYNKRIVKILLEYGADIKIHNKDKTNCLENECNGVWKEEYTQELIITGQPHNIKFFDDKIGILPSLKMKYKEVIEMSEMGIFG